MNVDELLRERGDQWQTPDVGGPDLDAALARSARRGAINRLAVAAVAVLAVGGTVAGVLSGVPQAIPAVPAGTPSATSTSAGTTAGPATPPIAPVPPGLSSDVLGEVAATLYADFHDTSAEQAAPSEFEVTGSTVDKARAIIAPATQTSPGTPVWVLQLKGAFACGQCTAPGGRQDAGPVLIALARQDNLGVISTGVFERPADLSDLAPVFGMELDLAPTPAEDEAARAAIRKALAGVAKADVRTDVVLRTTGWRATQRIWGHTPYPPSMDGVWLVQLTGSFTCSSCSRLGDSDRGEALLLVLDAPSGELQQMVVAGTPLDLSGDNWRSRTVWDPSLLVP
jgi:hypothetical protein